MQRTVLDSGSLHYVVFAAFVLCLCALTGAPDRARADDAQDTVLIHDAGVGTLAGEAGTDGDRKSVV